MIYYLHMLRVLFEHVICVDSYFEEVEVYIFNICWMGGLMLVSCIAHPSFFAWKFRRDHMVRPYRYNKHHMLPEKGYDAALYP
jgi:hypothetical protein